MDSLWIVGQAFDCECECAWELQGVFSTRELAVAACQAPHWFVGEMKMNEVLPAERVEWPNCFYPLQTV